MMKSVPLVLLAETFLERYSPSGSLSRSASVLVIRWAGFSGGTGFLEGLRIFLRKRTIPTRGCNGEESAALVGPYCLMTGWFRIVWLDVPVSGTYIGGSKLSPAYQIAGRAAKELRPTLKIVLFDLYSMARLQPEAPLRTNGILLPRGFATLVRPHSPRIVRIILFHQ